MRALVAGAGGFIGGHLVRRLLDEGNEVVGVDIKPFDEWWQFWNAADNRHGDLRHREVCEKACYDVDYVYNLACDMGGMGFIELNKAACMLSVLINTHMLMAAKLAGVKRYLYSSSACVYAADKQNTTDMPPLKEEDAYPAMAEDGYGWEKLFSERMCRHFMEDFGLECRVVRLHNVYGPHGSWTGGREKAPAAFCRKIAEAKKTGNHEIEVWGDGSYTRSFMWIDDCIEGLRRIMDSDFRSPINLGSAEQVTVNQLCDMVADIAGVEISKRYDLTKPLGVHGRSSDNTLIQHVFNWEPSTSLREGMVMTYRWVAQKVLGQLG